MTAQTGVMNYLPPESLYRPDRWPSSTCRSFLPRKISPAVPLSPPTLLHLRPAVANTREMVQAHQPGKKGPRPCGRPVRRPISGGGRGPDAVLGVWPRRDRVRRAAASSRGRPRPRRRARRRAPPRSFYARPGPLVAAEGGQAEEGRVGAGIAFVARTQASVAGQPRHGARLDDPAAAVQSFAGLDAFACDPYSDALAA